VVYIALGCKDVVGGKTGRSISNRGRTGARSFQVTARGDRRGRGTFCTLGRRFVLLAIEMLL